MRRVLHITASDGILLFTQLAVAWEAATQHSLRVLQLANDEIAQLRVY